MDEKSQVRVRGIVAQVAIVMALQFAANSQPSFEAEGAVVTCNPLWGPGNSLGFIGDLWDGKGGHPIEALVPSGAETSTPEE